jgi:hypothetical protein
VYRDREVKCWEGTHIALTFAVFIPGIILVTIGIPFVLYKILRNKRLFLKDSDTREKLGFLYQGYTEDHYYWETVIMSRKAMMGVAMVCAKFIGDIADGLLVIVVVVFFLALTLVKKPY